MCVVGVIFASSVYELTEVEHTHLWISAGTGEGTKMLSEDFQIFLGGNRELRSTHSFPGRGLTPWGLGKQRQVLWWWWGGGGQPHRALPPHKRTELSKSMAVTQRLVVMTQILGLWSTVPCGGITCQEGLRGMLCEVVPKHPLGLTVSSGHRQ